MGAPPRPQALPESQDLQAARPVWGLSASHQATQEARHSRAILAIGSPSLDCGGMPRAIGHEPTNRLSRTKARMALGFTPTYIARKATRATQLIGMAGRTNPFAESN
jgi:hypothetical protein